MNFSKFSAPMLLDEGNALQWVQDMAEARTLDIAALKEAKTSIKQHGDDNPFPSRKARFEAYDFEIDLPGAYMEGSTAVIPVKGCICKGASPLEKVFLGTVDTDDLQRELATAQGLASNILLCVDSPGGTVTGVPEMAQAVKDSNAPVYAYVDGMACSAAYYISAGAQGIFALGSARVGNIGCYRVHQNIKEFLRQNGVEMTFFASSEEKIAGHPYDAPTAKQAQLMQDGVDLVNEQFAGFVRANRPETLTDEALSGATYYGTQAVNIGLVDMVVSNMREVLDALS